jgi:glucan phosphoethanolaminetransferase (alkaline phosphatase superfamily)
MSELTRREFLLSMATVPFLSLRLPQLVQAATAPAAQDSASQPNIIILLYDTLSAHHISLQGYERETTPNLARLAEGATIFHNHYAGGNFTSPGTASLLTGLYP